MLTEDHLRGLKTADWDLVEAAAGRFEQALQRGERPDIADLLPPPGATRRAVLVELVLLELDYRQRAGEVTPLDGYLARFPELAGDADRLARRAGPGPPPPPGSSADTPGRGASDTTPPAGRAAPQPPPGYDIVGEVGHGGMGTVYRAVDRAVGRDIAVKVLHDRLRHHPEAAARFLDEARITGRLQHPAIPPVFAIGELADGSPYLAMKLIKGRTLADLLAGGPAPHLVPAFEQVCQAVAYAHAKGVIHRDLKPQNVMVGSFGEVQVMDWGLAKVLADPTSHQPVGAAEESTTVPDPRAGTEELATRTGSALGTPAYMSPEQAAGAVNQVDRRSDVFGLGGILCAVLTGRPPFVGSDAEAVRLMAAQGRVADAYARLNGSGADPALVALAKSCLAPDREARPADGGAVLHAVVGIRQAAEERVRRAELAGAEARVRAAEERKRRKVQLALASAVLLLVAGGGAFAWWQDKQATARQIETANRERDERERLARNGDALTALVGLCEKSLKADDAEAAGTALNEIARRLPEGGGVGLAGRITQCRADHALLVDLNRVDQFRWTPVGSQLPDRGVVAGRWREVFARHGLDPGVTPPAEAARRIADSWIKPRLLTAFDLWLLADSSVGVRELLTEADPDSYRDAVRDAVLARDATRVAELVGQVEGLAQPPSFAAVLGQIKDVAVDHRRAVLEAALQSRPGELALLMTLGNTYPIGQRGQAGEEVRWYQAAVAAHPRNVAARINLGVALSDKGDVDGAIACYREAIKLDPRQARTYYNLGNALRNKEDLDGAIASYQEAIRLDPDYAPAHVNLGNALRNKGNVDGAIAACREAIRLDPKYPPAHTSLGAALARKGELDQAIACYREAIKLDPKSAPAHTNLGAALQATKDVDGAIAAFREAIKLDPKLPIAHYNLGVARQARGEVDEAIACYREAIKLNPKYVPAHTNLGAALARKGELDEAIVYLREAIRLDPKNPNRQKALDTVLKLKAERDAKEGRIAPPPREVGK